MAGVLVAVCVVAAGGVLVWRTMLAPSARVNATIGTPKDLLISFPLDRQPVAGWRLSGADIGLPPGVEVGRLFMSTGDKAYFVAGRTDEHGESPVSWVYGVDTNTGKLLFTPIEMVGFRSGIPLGDCYGNGPGIAVCITVGDEDPARNLPPLVWVLDLDHGAVTFTGPTDLDVQGGAQEGFYPVHAIGNYRGETRLVALRDGEGVWGVGPKAERTWFVPGGGNIFDPGYLVPSDIPAPTIAMQNPTPDNMNAPYRVFSVVDGTDLTPTPPKGAEIRKSLVYNGGFAYSYREPGKHDGLLFYNTAGELVARYTDDNYDMTSIEEAVMPMARLRADPAQWLIFSAAGELVQAIPAPEAGVSFRVIGTDFFLNQAGTDDRWQKWDLLTGESGPICQMNLTFEYIGSDGSTVLVGGGLNSHTWVRAVDPATCSTRWDITSDVKHTIVKAGTGLIQTTPTEITQLVAPS